MELRDYLRILRRRWVLILACMMATMAVALAVTFNVTPKYSSNVRLFVSADDRHAGLVDTYQGSLFSQQRVASYAVLVNSVELSRRVVESLPLRMSPIALTKQVTATVVPLTVVLEISVTASDPVRAQRLAEAFGVQMRELISQIETPPGGKAPIKATIVDPASLPTSPVSPKPMLNLAIAGLVGVLLGYGVAVLREAMDSSVKSPEHVTETTGSVVRPQQL